MAASEQALSELLRRYQEALAADRELQSFLQKAKRGMLTAGETQLAAGKAGRRLGELLSRALSEISKDGPLSLQDAMAIVPKSLRRNYDFVSALLEGMQKDGALRQAVPAFDAERAQNLAKRAASYDRFAEHTRDFTELVENNSRGIVDDSQRETAEARYRMGLQPVIVRSQMGECCAWCAEVAGTYAYDPTHMDKRVFRRHRGCGCLIELGREGRREVVNNYTKADRRQDAIDIRQRIKAMELDPDYPSPAEMIRRRQEGLLDPNNRGEIAGRIIRGEYSLKQKHQKYLQHIKGTPQYKSATLGRKRDQSYLVISEKEAQSIIFDLSGKGVVKFLQGKAEHKEYIDAGRVIGYYADGDREWKPTNRVAIHHASDGSHIIPVKPLEEL